MNLALVVFLLAVLATIYYRLLYAANHGPRLYYPPPFRFSVDIEDVEINKVNWKSEGF